VEEGYRQQSAAAGQAVSQIPGQGRLKVPDYIGGFEAEANTPQAWSPDAS
jgi:hypothetical protein